MFNNQQYINDPANTFNNAQLCVCVCVCVCDRERESERERERQSILQSF